MHFPEWKVLYFDWNFIELCSQRSCWQQPKIGLDNGLVPNRRQASIWTNADQIHWRIYAALGDELIKIFPRNISKYGLQNVGQFVHAFIVIAIGDDYRFAFFGLVTKLWLKFQGLFY